MDSLHTHYREATRRTGRPESRLSREEGRTVVWLEGEHDRDTIYEITRVLIEAQSGGHHAIVVDLSGVTFMDASTINVLVAARDNSRRLSRGFALRSPSACAARLVELCGLGGLVEPALCDVATTRESRALTSWVAVPTTDRLDHIATAERNGDDSVEPWRPPARQRP